MKSTRKNSNLQEYQETIPSLPGLMGGLRKFSHHVVSRKSIKNKNLLIVDEQKLFHAAQENLYSARSPKNCLLQGTPKLDQSTTLRQVSPKLLSPKQQGEMIEYLQKKNEELINENKQKQLLINKLLGSCHQPRKMARLSSPQNELKSTPIPRSADTKRELELEYRLPTIKTPECLILQKRNELLNQQYNLSFGKQEDIKEKVNTQTSMKSHFSRLLMKLPQEFRFDKNF